MPYADPEKRRAYKNAWRRANYVPHPRKVLPGTASSRYWAKLKKRRKADPELDMEFLAKQRARYAQQRAEIRAKVRDKYYRDEAYRRRMIEKANRWNKLNKVRRGSLPVWLIGSVPQVKGTHRVHVVPAERAHAQREVA